MSDSIPFWREAINDNNHPMYQTAWLIFSKTMNLQLADKWLADKKDTVIEFLNQILDTADLYEEEALGGGFAPAHAIELLGHWQVESALPRMCEILESYDWDTIIYDHAVEALGKMGEDVVEPLLAMAEKYQNDEDFHSTVASIISDAAPRNARAFAFIEKLFNQTENHQEITYMAENLLTCDPEGGIPVVEARIKSRRDPKKIREQLQSYLADARAKRYPFDR